jgi:hypothetical protein
VFPNEHDSAREPVQSVARKRVPAISPVGAHDLDDGVEIVAAGWVDRHAGGLVDDNEVVILMYNANGFRCDRRLMTMKGMRDDIAVLDDRLCGRDGLAI